LSMYNSSTIKMIKGYVVEYPYRTLTGSACFLMVSTADIVGVAALFPLLSILSNSGSSGNAETNEISQWFIRFFEFIGLEMTIGTVLAALVIIIVSKSILTVSAAALATFSASYVGADTRQKMIKWHARAQWSLYQSLPAGRLAAAIGNEVTRVSQNYLSLAKLIADIIRSTIHLAFATYLAWEVTLAAIGVGFIAIFSLKRLLSITRREGAELTERMASFTTRLVDGLAGMKALKAMAKEKRLTDLLSWEVRGIQRAERNLNVVTHSTYALQEPIMMSALALGLYLMWDEWQGQMQVLVVLAIVFLRSVQTVFSMQKNYQALLQREASFWLVHKLLDNAKAHAEPPAGSKAPLFNTDIALKGVNFSYGSNVILKNTDFNIEVGTFTAVVGPSGTGKTSVVDMVIGIQTPNSGNVLIDGVPLSEYDPRAWRKMIGYVPQDSFLFHETIMENIALGDSSISTNEVIEALKLAESWDFVSGLPDGLETIAGEHGSRFSGGQRQRIAIARALVHKPKLLILDESTSALDPAMEKSICETLRRLSGKLTILAISHGHEIINAADKIFEIKDGNISDITSRSLSSTHNH
jgi:ATP-binding cassette, subfamily C, bacterial